jgi:hypothetical protein
MIPSLAGLRYAFDKFHMAPGLGTEGVSIVVRQTTPVESIRRDAVPFLARDFASFAPNTKSGISQEAYGTHKTPTGCRFPMACGCRVLAGEISQISAFVSMMRTLGS